MSIFDFRFFPFTKYLGNRCLLAQVMLQSHDYLLLFVNITALFIYLFYAIKVIKHVLLLLTSFYFLLFALLNLFYLTRLKMK